LFEPPLSFAPEIPSDRYRTIEVSVFNSVTYRFTIFAAFLAVTAFGQSAGPAPAAPDKAPAPALVMPSPAADAPAKGAEIQPDLTDPGVVRAQQNLNRVRALVTRGVLPPNDLVKAQDDLNDALDRSILRYSAVTSDLIPEQADQMVTVAERLYLRSQKRAFQNQQLAATGALSRAEAEAAGSEVVSAKLDLDLAIERARLVKDLAAQRALAEAENDAETHPELNGKLYTRYDGNGVFTRADFDRISAAYLSTFGHVIPVSADGQTEVHRAMGFNHAGRIDIALSPDQPEGAWLTRYLQRNHIPYYAFRSAVAHKATGAHIHLGTGSTRLASTKLCCGSSY
jgi:hypothetical protein